MTPDTRDLLAEMAAENERLAPRIAELMAKDPQLPVWTAMTIAQDEATVVRARQAIKDGESPSEAVHLVGSYARFGAAVELLPKRTLYRDIIDLWRGSDPDDSDPTFLEVWKAAHAAKVAKRGKYLSSYLRDGKPLPSNARTVTVYRGQDPGAPMGIAWTTDFDTAEKFARGAATRQKNREGVVLVAHVMRSAILAYITGRGESEVIVDPTDLMQVETLAEYRLAPKERA
jgi:hypothetical protein